MDPRRNRLRDSQDSVPALVPFSSPCCFSSIALAVLFLSDAKLVCAATMGVYYLFSADVLSVFAHELTANTTFLAVA